VPAKIKTIPAAVFICIVSLKNQLIMIRLVIISFAAISIVLIINVVKII
jgi:hypothetical protein